MTTVALEPVETRPGSLTDIAFDRIRTAIVSKALSPGSRVSESSLAAMLQVSKTPVREALLRLCHVGLVEPTTRGLQVVMPNRDIVRDVYELRCGLERHAAAVAALRADDAQRRAIKEAARSSLQKAKLGDAAGFSEWDLAFHVNVADATGNQLVAKSVSDAVALAFTLRSRDIPTIDDSVDCGKQHVKIAEAIAAGDGDSSGQLMDEHITKVLEVVLAAIT